MLISICASAQRSGAETQGKTVICSAVVQKHKGRLSSAAQWCRNTREDCHLQRSGAETQGKTVILTLTFPGYKTSDEHITTAAWPTVFLPAYKSHCLHQTKYQTTHLQVTSSNPYNQSVPWNIRVHQLKDLNKTSKSQCLSGMWQKYIWRSELVKWGKHGTIQRNMWRTVRPEYSTWRFSFIIVPYYSTVFILRT